MSFYSLSLRRPLSATLFPYTTLFRSRTAEMAKLTENAYRDVNIAFANELSMISDDLDINVWELIRLANHHPRSEEHTSELQSRGHLVCRLLLEKKNDIQRDLA